MTEPINPEVKTQWVEALRSGEYEQGKGALRINFPDGRAQFCCLGVLCDLAVKAGVEVEVDVRTHETEPTAVRYGYEGNTGVLPDEVRLWAGLDSDNGAYGVATEPDFPGMFFKAEALSSQNDQGATFAQIADIIEKEF